MKKKIVCFLISSLAPSKKKMGTKGPPFENPLNMRRECFSTEFSQFSEYHLLGNQMYTKGKWKLLSKNHQKKREGTDSHDSHLEF